MLKFGGNKKKPANDYSFLKMNLFCSFILQHLTPISLIIRHYFLYCGSKSTELMAASKLCFPSWQSYHQGRCLNHHKFRISKVSLDYLFNFQLFYCVRLWNIVSYAKWNYSFQVCGKNVHKNAETYDSRRSGIWCIKGSFVICSVYQTCLP
jgi:hypothetical protein